MADSKLYPNTYEVIRKCSCSLGLHGNEAII